MSKCVTACVCVCSLRCGYVEVPQEDSLEIDTPFDAVVAQAWVSYCQEGLW